MPGQKPRNVKVQVEFEQTLQRGEVTHNSLMKLLMDAGFLPSKVSIKPLKMPHSKLIYGAEITYKHDALSLIEREALMALLDGLYGIVGYVPPVVEPPPIPPTPDIASGFLIVMVDAAGVPILDANGAVQYETAEAQVERLALVKVGVPNIWVVKMDAAGVPILDAGGNYVYETVAEAAARLGLTASQVSTLAQANGLWVVILVSASGEPILDANGVVQYTAVKDIAAMLNLTFDQVLSITTQVVAKVDAAGYPILFNGTAEVGLSGTMVIKMNASGVPILDGSGNYIYETVAEAAVRLAITEAAVAALATSKGMWAVVLVDETGAPILDVNGDVQFTSNKDLATSLDLTYAEALALTQQAVRALDENGAPIMVAGELVKETTPDATSRLLGISEAQIMALAVVPPMAPGAYWRLPSYFNISVMKVRPDVDQGALMLQTKVLLTAGGAYLLEKTSSLEWMDEDLYPSSVYTHTRIKVQPATTSSSGLPLTAVYTWPKNGFQIETSPGVVLPVDLLADLAIGPPNAGVMLADFWVNALGEAYMCRSNRLPFTDYETASTTTPRL